MKSSAKLTKDTSSNKRKTQPDTTRAFFKKSSLKTSNVTPEKTTTPNISSFMRKQIDLSQQSVEDEMFKKVRHHHCEGEFFSLPTIQDIETLETLKKKLTVLEASILDPKNNEEVEKLCSEAATVQDEADELQIHLQNMHRNVRETKNALSKAKDVCAFWLSKKKWNEVYPWQKIVNAAELILKTKETPGNTTVTEDIISTQRTDVTGNINQTECVIDLVHGESVMIGEVFPAAKKNTSARKKLDVTKNKRNNKNDTDPFTEREFDNEIRKIKKSGE